jgi:hypothetical protein
MVKLLITWTEDQTQKLIPPSTATITTTAKAMLEENAGPDYNIEVTASSGWFK